MVTRTGCNPTPPHQDSCSPSFPAVAAPGAHLSYLLVIRLHERVHFNPQGLRVRDGVCVVTDPLCGSRGRGARGFLRLTLRPLGRLPAAQAWRRQSRARVVRRAAARQAGPSPHPPAVNTAGAARPSLPAGPGRAPTPPALLTVNAALHGVTLCRHQQRTLQGHGGRHPAGLPEHHVGHLEPLRERATSPRWQPSPSPNHRVVRQKGLYLAPA